MAHVTTKPVTTKHVTTKPVTAYLLRVLQMQAIFLWSVQASWAELHDIQWYVYVDDDTYVLWEPMLELLRRYDPAASHYFGRPLQEEGYPIFVGGGAGIVLSRAAAMQILAAGAGSDCDPLHLKVRRAASRRLLLSTWSCKTRSVHNTTAQTIAPSSASRLPIMASHDAFLWFQAVGGAHTSRR